MSRPHRSQPRRSGPAPAGRGRALARRRLAVWGLTAVLVAIVAIGFAVSRARDTSGDVAAPPAGTASYGVTIGDPSAPHTVVVYEDFLCPYCAQLEAATRDELERLADAGRVHVEYRPFDLLSSISDYSIRSANAFAVVLEASGPEVAKGFHDLLYAEQPSEGGPYPDDDQLVALAVRAGAVEGEVRTGILGNHRLRWVEDATRLAEDAGVRGTPTILLDGRVFQDGRTVDDLAANLLRHLR